jgi:[ribosomal protein S18]-alanine N-acetyltransferase
MSVADVRLAAPADAPAMAAIHAACFARSWDADAIAQFLGIRGCLALIAYAAGDLSAHGFLIVRSAGDEAELLTLAVHPDHRRIGLARALLVHATARLRAAGAKQIFLEVDEANASARGLYQSLGAVVVGHRKRYYEHGADADIFSLAL